LRTLRGILAVFMMLVVIGGPWTIMQVTAWTTMLAGNLRSRSFSEAVTCTFDGQHPCSLCNAIAAQKKSESKSEATPALERIEFLPMTESFAMAEPASIPLRILATFPGRFLEEQPPTPPPRLIGV
jgi:hypothetical protein